MIVHKLLVILGSTSTGKTDLALRLAGKFNGEVVACDSRQVYKGLDIGTGKLPSVKYKVKSEELKKQDGFWEMNGIKIWMYDVADPKKQYTVYDYVRDANKVMDDIIKRGKRPIIVGGTGLYIKALLEGLPNLVIPLDLELREELKKLSLQELQKRLQKLSPYKWYKMNHSDRQNPRRLVRVIEIMQSLKLKAQNSKLQLKTQNYNILKIGLTAPRQILYQRIDERVTSRIKQGMVNEAEKLHQKGLSYKRMKQLGLEYGVLADYLEGKISSRDELIKQLQFKIHGYARRQITWFKKENKAYWFDITQNGWEDKVERQINSWYYVTYGQTY